jgi:hypothetical protein
MIAVSLVAAVGAQQTASAVHVAQAPQFGARVNFGGYSPYAARGQFAGRGQLRMPYGARAQNPYMMRAPVAAPVAAPVVEAVAVVVEAEPNAYNHVDDYTAWRIAYLTAQAEKSDAMMHSPLLDPDWKWSGTSPITNTDQQGLLREQYELQSAKGKMQAAEYMLNVAAQNDAPLEELQEIKKFYDYERLKQMNIMVGSNAVMTYQIARQDYEWDANSAQAAIASATTDFEKRKAQLDMQEAQMGLMSALDPLMGNTGSYTPASSMGKMVGFMADAASAQGRQGSFDDSAAQYEANPTAANMYEMQIAELKLEKAEASYMRSLAGYLSPLAALMNGNYRSSLNYKKQQIESKIADLEEKLAAERYKQRQGKSPFGRTANLASEQKTQRAFFNLLTSGSGAGPTVTVAANAGR